MRRNPTPSFEGFDPDVIEAAREVALRAGVPLETWMASVLPAEKKPARRRRAPEETSAPEPASAPPKTAEPDTADRFTATLDALMSRLDAIDRTIAEDRVASKDAAGRGIEEIEARIAKAVGEGAAPVQKVADRLGDIERRMSELGEQLAAPRPLGRRGRPAIAEKRDAVSEIRQRQRELDGGEAGSDGVGALQRNLEERIEASRTLSPAISELQRETSRLRESIGGLATGQDVGALEQAMLSLANGVERTQEPANLAAIAAPIELIRVQVERLAGDVADNVHARVARDVERLAARVDSALSGGATGFADRDALSNLFGELDEIRRLIASLAGPERIQSLAQGVQAISAQVAQLQRGVGADHAEMAELRPLLEEIRSGLKVPNAGDLAEQIQAMARKLDALHERAARSAPAESQAILGRIDALADRMERVSASPVGELIDRLEEFGETLRQPPRESAELATIQAQLRILAEKVDGVGARGGSEGLDALERQVLALTNRIDARGADPTLAGLERTMSELLRQVSSLREEAPIEAAAELAARNAVAAMVGRSQNADPAEIGGLRSAFSDLLHRHEASDQRLQSTLAGVQSALDRLVARLGTVEGDASVLRAAPKPPQAREEPIEERLLASTSMPAPRARGGRRPELPRISVGASVPAVDTARVADELLEPGAGRPSRETVPETGEPGDASADIKTSFIAAARRAAQAAQAEVASEASLAAELREDRAGIRASLAAPSRSTGRTARLKAEIDRRRRPLLLGLAAIVLLLGALQAIGLREDSAPAPAAPQIVESAPRETPAADSTTQARPAQAAAQAPVQTPAEPRTAPADPQTTQAIPARGADAATPAPGSARSVVPQVAGMGTLAGDLAGVPTGLAKLRQAALEGDGAAIYELASREADGRGMPRDLAVAAKLYEKLAAGGYAPAQYKLAGHHEKGSGVIRDLGQAKLWYGRAAEQGHARSMHNLAVLYAENPGPSGRPDYATASSWFRRAAEFGVRDSQYNLAVLYARGLGVTQDLVQSYAWFAAAAAQGDDDAGKKRDDVAAKLSPSDLANARSIATAFKPRRIDPAINEPPPSNEAPASMTLLGAPPPSGVPASFTPPKNRT
ncbi:localization factor PodJL [Methylobacterium sp. BE186]|uniref:hypothetical protein n=1 Tax=Methylobacterium sp. BE186 TaxID=2817715 RepID=UPI00285B19DB|nr:hypothetical protein [Methylobacterium sp. BE186]MDR7037835.1 localization factor PodJL [Methylobacterium sp. BE186]